MKRILAFVLLSCLCTSCASQQRLTTVSGEGFSFDERELPSLMDINQRKFSIPAQRLRILKNVDESFAKFFSIVYDEEHHVYILRDKRGHILFSGNLPTPRYVASLDIDADQDQDVILQCAAYGNHGNGTEIFEVLLNDNGAFTRIRNPLSIDYVGGQENRAGHLTWVSDPKVCAIFVGETADVVGDGSEASPLRVTEIRAVTEVFGYQDGSMVLLSRTSSPIDRKEAKYMSFR